MENFADKNPFAKSVENPSDALIDQSITFKELGVIKMDWKNMFYKK